MTSRGHQRQVVLFLAAILAPCVVLVAVSARMIGQERELADKRLADDRQRLKSQQFVSSVSHEIKTPLTAIRMFALKDEPGQPRHLKTVHGVGYKFVF